MKWVDQFTVSMDRLAGESVRREVLEAGGKLGTGSRRKAAWIKAVMAKLETLVDEETMKRIMTATCPHKYPRGRIQKLKKTYAQLGDLDQLLEVMRRDRSWKGTSYYDQPVRQGNVIYLTKVPCNPEAYHNAKTADKKRLAYCHCPWIGAVLREAEKVSSLFCYCATGWDKQLWAGILEQPVKVEVVKSLLTGDDCCTHAVYLPPDAV